MLFNLGFMWQVFPKGSPLVFDISKAILEVIQSGEMQQLEKNLLSSNNCSSSSNLNDDPELGPEPFYGLFGISGFISALAFLITLVRLKRKYQLRMHFTPAAFLDSRVFIWAILFLSRIYVRFQSPYRRRTIVVP